MELCGGENAYRKGLLFNNQFSQLGTVTENPSTFNDKNKGFRFHKLSDFKELISFVRIGGNSKAKIA